MVNAQVDLEQHDYLLETIRLRVQGDLFFTSWVSPLRDTPLTLALYPADAQPPPAALIDHLGHLAPTHPQTHHLHAETHGIAPFVGGVVACNPLTEGTLVTGVLTYGDHTYTAAAADDVARAGAVSATLMNVDSLRARHERQSQLLDTCRVLPDAANPQALVEDIQAHYLDEKVSACVLLLYGPNNTTSNTIEYVEVAGTWGRSFGAGYGLGTRIYLNNDDHIALLDALQRKGAVFPTDKQIMTFVEQDALFRGLLRARVAEDWALHALHTTQERIGVVLLATDDPDGFTAQDHQHQRDLVEVITVVVTLQVIRRELSANKYGRAALLDAVNDGVIIAAPGTNGAIVTMMNERFREMFNWRNPLGMLKLDQVLQQMEVPPSVKHQLAAAWRGTPLRDQKTLRGTFEMVTHQGQPAAISWYSAPMYNPEGDDVFARVYIFHDTTPEQAAAQVRTAFLQRVSHELRTPLTAISGFSEFILEATGDDLPVLAREYTEIIHDSARHLRDVFTDLIDITRAYAGEVTLNLHETEIAIIAQAVVQQLQPTLRASEQSAAVDVQGTPRAHADSDRIGQVLRHLLENASLYSPPGAQIHIRISVAETRHDLPKHAPADIMLPGVFVQVIDTGPGIVEADAATIFEPFHRGQQAYAQQIPGTGLGLTLVQSLIDLHRGKIWVEPATNRRPGGRMCFVLPVAH